LFGIQENRGLTPFDIIKHFNKKVHP